MSHHYKYKHDVFHFLVITTHVTHVPHIYIKFKFYIHGSVHRDSVLIRSNKMQQYAGIYLLHVYSTCFGRPSRPSSGVQQTVTAASGTGHNI